MDAAWLTAKRWYGAADRELRSLAVVDRERVVRGLEWQVVEACFAEGERAYYQIFWDDDAGEDGAERAESLRWLLPELGLTSARLLSGEQSNTSVVCEPGPVVVKVFRRLTAEANPDAVVVRRLWDSGFRGVPEPLFERRRPLDVPALSGAAAAGDESGIDLAVARRFLVGSVDGWSLAVAAADGFEQEAGDLGRLTADMHLALVRAFDSQPLDPDDTVETMAADAHRVLGADAPVSVFRRLSEMGGGRAIRPHGDYHLGQVLRHERSWYVLDFEGEPARPIAERMRASSPLRDVAGMLRSFAYAVAVAGHDASWEEACRRAFLSGYLSTPGIDALLPSDPLPLIDAFELDKAVYEVAYERANRPDWVPIPMAAVARLAGQRR
ncbi:MAG: maltokinase [Acidimicrobiia bacterium]|jgi:maltokinase|nr:maltokinase [Acidimicrobiia bacterium]